MSASFPVDGYVPPWSSFAEFFDSRAGQETPFLTDLDNESGTRREWTSAEWRRRVLQTGAALAATGVRPGDTVAALCGNTADALALAFACWRSGFCYLPLNSHEALDRHGFIVADADAALLVHTATWEERARAIGRATGVPTAPSAEVTADDRHGPIVERPDIVGLDAPALRVYTSGTTGNPKGVVLTAANLLTDCDALERGLAWEPATRILTVLPVHHVNGLVISSLLPWYAGHSTVLCDRFRSDRFWGDVARENANACSMVPSLLEFLLAERGDAAPEHFREVLCGAGPLMPDTALEFERAFGVAVRHLYGLSETTAVATLMPRLTEGERKAWHVDHGFPSIGPSLPHVEVEVHRRDGQPCEPGERGEIVIRGATVMTGYAGRPADSAETLRDGWFHSGDEGFWLPDADGRAFFFITGRMKELIIRGGVNISPFQIDEVLRSHPAVRFGLAVPFENRFYGEEVAAYVVADRPVTEQEILDFCATRLDYAYQPKVVVFGEEVPFTSTGKAKRLSLKKDLDDRLAEYREVQFRRHRRPPAQETVPHPDARESRNLNA